jgi:DNA-binding GntR family transcriptional regulator
LSEGVADLLRREIQLGELQPGERLPQNDIAKKYGVSITPVREALAYLQSEGLVRIDPHRGALVFEPRIEDLTESYEIRGALEALAVDKAIDRLTRTELVELQVILDEMRRNEGKEAWVALNNEFHQKIYGASGLPRLTEMIRELREWAGAYIHLWIKRDDFRHRMVNDEHQALLQFCIARDHDGARATITNHVMAGLRNLSGLVEGREQQAGGSESAPNRTPGVSDGRETDDHEDD